jgi:hypothetical protein
MGEIYILNYGVSLQKNITEILTAVKMSNLMHEKNNTKTGVMEQCMRGYE